MNMLVLPTDPTSLNIVAISVQASNFIEMAGHTPDDVEVATAPEAAAPPLTRFSCEVGPKLKPILSLVRLIACASIFVVFMWMIVIFPTILEQIPLLWPLPKDEGHSVALLRPSNVLEAFDLGVQAREYASLSCNESVAANATCADVLKAAGEAIGAGPLTHAQLIGIRDIVEAVANERSVGDRILGFFSFVNILWTISIVGVAATVGPCLYYVFGEQLRKAAEVFYKNFIVPAHKWGVLEAAAYAFTAALATQAARYPQGFINAGAQLALLSGLLFIGCWFYSAAVWATGGGDEKKYYMLTNTFIGFVFAPLAIAHDSAMLGFAAVLAFYFALGFVFEKSCGGFEIGFKDSNSAVQSLKASTVLVCFFSLARISGISLDTYIAPFAPAGMILGNVVGLLALLILSTAPVCGPKSPDYPCWNALTVVTLLLLLGVGAIFHIPAMLNTAITFLVLYVMTKQVEIEVGGGTIVLVFLNFLALFFIGLFLSHNTGFLLPMFSPDGLYLVPSSD